MEEKKYLNLTGLSSVLSKINSCFARLSHTHTKADIIGLSDNEAVEYIALTDRINSYTYIIEMRDGQLCASCECSSIMVSKLPDKINYEVGETLDLTGLEISATCKDGSIREIPVELCVINHTDGEELVTITYTELGKEYTTNFAITIASIETQLVDFEYTTESSTYTLTEWKGTTDGVESTECIIPDDPRIIL